MPVYDFKNTKTGEITEHRMTIAELSSFKEAHPELEQCVGGTMIGDPVILGFKKIDNSFREELHQIAERTPGGQGLKKQIR